jgi:L-methionine (R)-S-oxide reductase
MTAHFEPASTTDRVALRQAFPAQVKALLEGETDAIAAMANTCAAIHTVFGWHWVGFYRVVGNELVLGPFQGPVACTRIGKGRGVCGIAWEQDRVQRVPDVELFPGHIACSALSRSELVIPLHDRHGHVAAVLDLDSVDVDAFTEEDVDMYTAVCRYIEPLL